MVWHFVVAFLPILVGGASRAAPPRREFVLGIDLGALNMKVSARSRAGTAISRCVHGLIVACAGARWKMGCSCTRSCSRATVRVRALRQLSLATPRAG